MLGVRLDRETELGLQALARRTGQPKSQIAREAIRHYIAKNDKLTQAKEEWAEISRRERDDPEINEILSLAMRELGGDR